MNDEELYKEFFDSKLTESEVNQLSSLVLAFVGDVVFSFYVKTKVLNLTKLKVNALNANTSKLVNAHSQREMLFKLMPILTEQEAQIVKRARNTNIHTKAKNYSIEEYRHATAFEALIGYLYLIRRYERLNEILKLAVEQNED
ncbi:MAG: Mini-ribonuclease 3 [Christensenellales bacterium]